MVHSLLGNQDFLQARTANNSGDAIKLSKIGMRLEKMRGMKTFGSKRLQIPREICLDVTYKSNSHQVEKKETGWSHLAANVIISSK